RPICPFYGKRLHTKPRTEDSVTEVTSNGRGRKRAALQEKATAANATPVTGPPAPQRRTAARRAPRTLRGEGRRGVASASERSLERSGEPRRDGPSGHPVLDTSCFRAEAREAKRGTSAASVLSGGGPRGEARDERSFRAFGRRPARRSEGR